MAFGVNTVTILGNLTRDPELRFTPSGAAVVGFGVAVNRNIQNKASGEWETEADFFNVTAWNKLAENCAESLNKGDRVIVTGRLSQDSWEDKKDGSKRSVVKITANTIGPSLEFASAKIEKNPKIDNGVTDRPKPSAPKPSAPKEEADFTDEDIPF